MTYRVVWALFIAGSYKLAMLPLALAGFVLVPFAIWFGVTRPSKLTGQQIFTAPDALAIWGNEQDGYDPEWAVTTIYSDWPTFWRRYAWAAWRNKIRNVAFVRCMQWLHKPKGELITTDMAFAGLLIRVRERGWHTEVEYVGTDHFGDFGPRLDQPDQWGGCSWAFRPWGKL